MSSLLSRQAWPDSHGSGPGSPPGAAIVSRSSSTVSGLAAIEISRSTETVLVALFIALSLLSFRLAFERLQPLGPELVEERLQLPEPFRARSVETPRAVASLAHEPRLLQHAQMLRDRGPRQLEVRRDLSCRELAVAHERQDPPPVRLGDRSQRRLHEDSVSDALRKPQLNYA